MRLNNENINISALVDKFPSELGQFQASEGNAIRLLFQEAMDAQRAAQESDDLRNRLRAIGYDQFALRFDSSGISIIDGGSLENALDAWVTKEGGLAREAARKIREAFYDNTKRLYLINFSLRTLPPILQLLDLADLNLTGNQLTTFDATGLANLTRLHLNANQLTTFDARGLANLTHLYLSGNRLTALDASGLANLTCLDLSGNRLTALDASGLANLTDLNLSGNQLTTFDARGLVNLTNLYLSRNQLTTFDAKGLANLTNLYLSRNQLTTFDARGLANLTDLNLSGNQLITFDTTGLVNLTDLNLSGNHLTTFDATGLANLTDLNLSGNHLTTLDARGLANLIYLDLADNAQLSNLPLALCQCTNLRTINRLGTQISDRNCDAILAQCQVLRAAGATLILPIRLETWISVSGENFKLSFILEEMTDDEKGVINEWLARLERTRDFSTNSQRALAKEACSMLRDLNLNPVFRESFFAQVPQNNEACGDRAGMAFNELYLSWRLATLPQSATEKEKLQIIIQAAKTIALRRALQRIISTYGGNQAESVEIYLYYEKELKEPLQLLTAINTMLYPTIGRRDWIKDKELVAEVNSTYIDALCALPQLKELALKDLGFAKQYEAMNEDFTGMLENVGEGISSKNYLVNSEEVSIRRAENERALLQEWVTSKDV